MKREVAALCLVWGLLACVFGCSSPSTGSSSSEHVATTAEALTTSGLDLTVSKNSCWNSGAQDYFNVKNSSTSSVKLSDITIKYWVYDTSGSPVVPHVWYGGCVTTTNGACTHQVSGVTATAIQFPGCGPDSTHRANWEITISSTDNTLVTPGMTWSGVQTAINLANSASFGPGSGNWFSGCGNGQAYVADPHFVAYLRGQAVSSNGVDTSCRKTPPFSSLPTDAEAILPTTGTVAGRLLGTSNVDAAGAFSYRIPIEVPPGRGGMEPHLAFKYSSTAGNGLLGVGWNLEGPSSIARCRKVVAREGVSDSIKVKLKLNGCTGNACQEQFQHYDGDLDNFCLDGEKLVRVGGTDTSPEFRTERDSLAKIIATYSGDNWPSKFTVSRRDGKIATYKAGVVTSGVDSRDVTTGQPNGASFSGVLAWPIDSEQDRFGNAVSYAYTTGDDASAAQALSTITYTTCVAGSACPYGGATRLVQFNYETRSDYLSHWVAGLNAGVSIRLSSVDVSTSSAGSQSLVRSYRLSYDTSSATSRARLISLSLCDGNNECLAPTLFQWGGGKGTDYRRSWHVVGTDPPSSVSPGQCTAGNAPPGCFRVTYEPTTLHAHPDAGDPFLVGDFDGNGSDDLLVYSGDTSGTNNTPSATLKLSIPKGGTALFQEIRIKADTPFSGGGAPDYQGARAVDIDQDGQVEVLVPDTDVVPGNGHVNVLVQDYKVYRYSSVIRDFVQVFRDDGSPVILSTPANFQANTPTLLDIDGDGVLDYFYDTNTIQPDGHGHLYQISRAQPGATSLVPQSYTSPLPLAYTPSPADQNLYNQGRCRFLPIDFAGHGYNAPAAVCNDPNTATFFADLNGDGLSDILKINSGVAGSATARLSTGVEVAGDFAHAGLAIATPENQALPTQTLAGTQFAGLQSGDLLPILHNQVADFNGDGLADVLQLQTATATEAPALWLGQTLGRDGTSLAKVQLPYTQERFGDAVAKVGDFNGDGLPDIVQGVHFHFDSGDNQEVDLQFLIQDPSNNDDLITHISSDEGALADLTYKAATTLELGPPGAPIPSGPVAGVFAPRRGLTVVSQATLVEGQARKDYRYFYTEPAADTSGRGFLGFHAVYRADLLTATGTVTIYENERLEGSLHGYHVFPYAFIPNIVETRTGSDALTSDAFTGLTITQPPASSILVTRSEVSTASHRVHPLNSSDGTLNSGSTFFVEDFDYQDNKKDEHDASYAVLSQQKIYDDFANVTSLTSFNGEETTTRTTSFNNDASAQWLIALPNQQSTTRSRLDAPSDSQTTSPSVVTYTYGTVGELMGVTSVAPSGAPTQTVTTLTRDAAGLVKSVAASDAFNNERGVSYDYSPDGVYREHIQDALGHDTWIGHHSGLGVPLISFDVNGNSTLYQYDGLGRVLTVSPTRAPITNVTYQQAAAALRVTTSQSPGTRVAKQYDELGNLVATTTNVGGHDSATLYTRDGLGRLLAEEVPYFQDDSVPAGQTFYRYDNLNEVRTVNRPDGSTITVNLVDALTTEIISTGDQTRDTVVTKTDDGLIASVRENAASGPTTTRGVDYVYGQGQELDQVVELGGPTTSFFYFGSPKPVKIVSSESGQTTIQYDGFNNPRHVQHNANYPSTLDYEYDALGRPIHITSAQPDPATPTTLVNGETRYVYDSGPGAVGQLSSATSPDGVVTRHSYTPEGLPSEDELNVGGSSFLTDYSYDPTGRLSHVDYPDAKNGLPRVGIDLAYNDAPAVGLADGSLHSVLRGSASYWLALRRGATGMAEDVQLPGNLTQSIAVDANTRRVTGIVVDVGQTQVYDVQYDYFSGGNISSRTDNLAGTSEQYTYDAFDQLETWSATSNAGASREDYVYDSLGNQKATGVATNVFGGTGFSPHQIASRKTSSETRTFSYDPLGRQTSMKTNGVLTRSVAYTPFDLPHRITTPSKTVNYAYDANQHKVSELSGPTSTTYVGDLYERRVNNTTCKVDDVFYVFADGQRIAQIVQEHDASSCTGKNAAPAVETVSALHSDLHGTVTAATTLGSAFATTRQAFSPWGARLPLSSGSQSSSIDKVTVGFTDQEQDDGVGLVNMRGRMYDSVTRTFLTTDPIVGAPFKVSGWNKYSYVLNNPLKYVDPSGFDLESETPADPGDPESSEVLVFDPDLLQGPSQSVAPSTPTTPEAFDPGQCSDASCTPASVSQNGAGGVGSDVEPIRNAIDFLNRDPNRFLNQPSHADIPIAIPTPGSQIAAANDGVEGTGPSEPAHVDAPFYVDTLKSTQPLLGMVGPPVGDGAAAVIEEGKLGYLLGQASGRAHNLERALQNAGQMARVGVQDTAAGRALLQSHLQAVAADSSNLAQTFSNQYGNYLVKESLFAGPGGFLRLESTWQVMGDGSLRFITAIPFGG